MLAGLGLAVQRLRLGAEMATERGPSSYAGFSLLFLSLFIVFSSSSARGRLKGTSRPSIY